MRCHIICKSYCIIQQHYCISHHFVIWFSLYNCDLCHGFSAISVFSGCRCCWLYLEVLHPAQCSVKSKRFISFFLHFLLKQCKNTETRACQLYFQHITVMMQELWFSLLQYQMQVFFFPPGEPLTLHRTTIFLNSE